MSRWNYIFALAIRLNGYYFLLFQTPIFYYRFTDRSIWQKQDKSQLAVHVYYKVWNLRKHFSRQKGCTFCRNHTHYLSALYPNSFLLVCPKPITCLNIFLNSEIFLASPEIWSECFSQGKTDLKRENRTHLLLGKSSKKECWHATFPNQRQAQYAIK